MKRFFYHGLVLGYLVLVLGACAASDIPDAKPTTGRNPTVAEIPSQDETVRGEDDPPIVTLELGAALRAKRLSKGDELPGHIIIPTTNLNAVPVTAALQAVLTGTDVSLSWNTGTLGDNLVTVVNLSGPLPKVIEHICSAAKVFCSFRNGSLELGEKETFVVSTPPIARGAGNLSGGSGGSGGGGNSMVEMISQLSGGKAQTDEQGGNVIYTTNVEGQERVSTYLEQLRNGRPLVVLQLYIWEVTLNKQNAAGINWSDFKLGKVSLGPLGTIATTAASNFASVTGDSVSLGAITTGPLKSNSVLQFLSTQGRVQTISNPQITFVSGSTAKFVAGGEQSYISSVGQLVSATNVSGTNNASSTSGVGANTINQDKIKTGLTVDVSGAYENGVVFANLDLNLINLVRLVTAAGTVVQTPITSNREVNTIIRVRPGDNLLMAGLVTSADTNNREGVPLPGDTRIPTYGNEQLENTELVVMVKPSIVMFSDKGEEESIKKKQEKNLPDAIVIDKDGSQKLALPTQAVEPLSLPPQAATLRREPLPYTPAPEPSRHIPIAPSEDGAPVDKRLMQRGFSHAFDDLLQPMPTHLSSGSGMNR